MRKWIFISVGSVVGLIIVLTVVGLTTGSTSTGSQPTIPKPHGVVRLHYGQKATLASVYTTDGIVSLTVSGLQTQFTSQTSNHPDAGDAYAVIAVRACAGPNGADTSNTMIPFPFQLVAGNQALGALDAPDAAKEPDLGNLSANWHANQCQSGYMTFEYPKGATPTEVIWASNPGHANYEWTPAG